MRIDDDFLRAVVFLGYEKTDGSQQFIGTGVFIKFNKVGGKSAKCIVTARHVVERIRDLGISDVKARVNHTDGTSSWHPLPVKFWSFSEDRSKDVAITGARIHQWMDHGYISSDSFLIRDQATKYDVGAGDIVSVIGMFHMHTGSERNEPIVRTGNIAAFDVKNVSTKLGRMNAHLIECRSIGGLSGSPVLISLSTDPIDEEEKEDDDDDLPEFSLLGLIHGHFDIDNALADATDQSGKLHTGIALVTPIESIVATFDEVLVRNGQHTNDRLVDETGNGS